MIIGTAGHIDHGKTTLVRALTGVDTDRLKEEKARGISIELGYAYLPSANGETLGFIDVPGHEKLVHTMVAGASGIDFGLLVVAADDGVMPQTREHLAILDLMGVGHGAVALTKIDCVDPERVATVRAEVATLLAGFSLHDAPIFPVNATDPADPGARRLLDHLAAHAAVLAPRARDRLFRLAVDRVFTLPGRGTIVTGTVFAGSVRVAREDGGEGHAAAAPAAHRLVLAPAGTPLRVRSLHAQSRPADEGHAGQRCALNLAGIGTDAVTRGDWVADARAFLPALYMDVELRLLGDADCSVRTWARLHVHWGAAHHMAHVVPLSSNSIGPGQRDRAQLVFDRPVCATPGDRYIVRNAQASRTIGGGVVLDPNAAPRRRRGAERHAWLDAIAAMLRAGDPAPLLAQAPLGLAGATLARMTGLPFERLSLPADALCLPTRGPDALPVVILRAHWAVLRDGALAALRKFHESAPDEPGIDGMRLRRMAWPALDDAVLHALVEAMLRDGAVARNGPWLHLPGHAVALTEPESALSAIVLPQLFQGGFDPPWVRDLARINGLPEEQIRLLLRKQMRRGEVCRVVPDLYYHRERVRELAQRLATLAAAHGGVPAAAFRDATGLGRKRAVQVLEFFDRVGYTRRVRDAHVLRGDTAWRNPGHDDASQSGSRAGMPKFRP